MRNIGVKKSFITLLISFFLLNFLTAIILNSSFIASKLKDNYFFTVELKNDLSEENINKLENKLLLQPEVKAVRFITKEEAFRNLQKELGIVISNRDNPLPNSLLVSFNDTDDIEKIQELLDNENGVKEIFLDSNHIENTKRRIKGINTFSIFILGTDIAVVLMIYLIFSGGTITDYLRLTITNPGNARNYKRAQNINLFPFMGASIMGSLLFFNLYIIFRKALLDLVPNLSLMSFHQMVFIISIIIIFFNIFVWLSPSIIQKNREGKL
ncbi:MAG: permease-like cell division protein FtsX [Cetobacterium sp.]|uniref:cell division protein FtsX n=1 Tax=unclassified Cetobacterium TaxID=2630983 RepID=UPI00163CBD06|nr:permease-like cell division protein FtsX [Cetobacterium sp. 2A]MBC2856001.1 hypothetical protein [Cetobacterium sp. 2A]